MYVFLCFCRSLLHMLWMVISIIPWALFAVSISFLVPTDITYRICRGWMAFAMLGLKWICGVHWRVQGWENLPTDHTKTILLSKHQSTLETLLYPAVFERPLAYVFKKELLRIPFFGWSMARLEMIHIDRSQKIQAFQKVSEQGRAFMEKGIWIIMFPEGTRIPRGQVGTYKSGGARLAIDTQANIIPIAVNSAKCWPTRGFIKYPGVVDIIIGAPISAHNKEPDFLMTEVQTWIETKMQTIDQKAYST